MNGRRLQWIQKTFWILLLAGVVTVPSAPASGSKGPQPSTPIQSPESVRSRALVTQYCVGCHNARLKTAGLALDAEAVDKPGVDAPVWEKVVRKLRTGTMPPAAARHPSAEEYTFLISYLENGLDAAAAAQPNPGRLVVHRLNRSEYGNAVRDLLAVDVDAIDLKSLLPADETSQGFDNISTALSVSPLLMERYLAAAKKITRIAIGDPEAAPVFTTYTAPKFLMQDEDRVSEDLAFGSRGGMAVRHYFPLEGDYSIQILLQRTARTYIRGLLAGSHEIDVTLDGKAVQSFKVGGESKGPSTGDYSGPAVIPDAAQEQYERTADKDLQLRAHVTAGTHVVGVTFPKKTFLQEGPQGVLQPPLGVIEFSQFKGGPPAVGSVVIGGPYDGKGIGDTASRQRVFVCRPSTVGEEDVCARRILSTLAHRAYRRPVTERDATVPLSFYKDARKNGDFDAGIRAGVQRILLDPEFLFRIEHEPTGIAANTPYRISDLELASRLSFFLWSSIPDDELLSAAEQGRLKDVAVLDAQVRRMLRDPRSTAMMTNFAGQWLLLRNLRSLNPDAEIFPYFDDNLREALQRETELFMESQLREDHGITELLTANYTFLNNRLAEHYGVPGVYGSRFRRVTLTDENRIGLLGKGSILAVTSYANRTAPTLRGKWILDNFLGAAPPPPPPDVPDLKDNASTGKVLTMRERMEQHRANPACATCHQQMDPLGFALENFDAIGGWLPKTIDNDVAMTDASFGFDTALGIATEAIDRLHSTAHSHHRIIVTEIMGHRTGWLTLGAGIAGGADVILIPEIPYDVKKIARAIRRRSEIGTNFSIVAIAEGALSREYAARFRAVKARKSRARSESALVQARAELAELDQHHAGNTLRLAARLEKLTGLECRVTILGYVQRGGAPSAVDRLLASRLGTACAEFIYKGVFGVMVAARGEGTLAVPLDQVAAKRKEVPPNHPWIATARAVGTSLGD